MRTPRDFMAAAIKAWAGAYSGASSDPGNWTGGQVGSGRLVGSMYDVTPQVLARHRGISIDSITVAVMKSVTPEESADIAQSAFYVAPHFDTLTWAPATAALLDFGWGSGPGQATKSMQRLVGADADGVLGDNTRKAYNAWLVKLGDVAAMDAMCQMRVDFYEMICQSNPSLSIYLQGWKNRTNWVRQEAPL